MASFNRPLIAELTLSVEVYTFSSSGFLCKLTHEVATITCMWLMALTIRRGRVDLLAVRSLIKVNVQYLH